MAEQTRPVKLVPNAVKEFPPANKSKVKEILGQYFTKADKWNSYEGPTGPLYDLVDEATSELQTPGTWYIVPDNETQGLFGFVSATEIRGGWGEETIDDLKPMDIQCKDYVMIDTKTGKVYDDELLVRVIRECMLELKTLRTEWTDKITTAESKGTLSEEESKKLYSDMQKEVSTLEKELTERINQFLATYERKRDLHIRSGYAFEELRHGILDHSTPFSEETSAQELDGNWSGMIKKAYSQHTIKLQDTDSYFPPKGKDWRDYEGPEGYPDKLIDVKTGEQLPEYTGLSFMNIHLNRLLGFTSAIVVNTENPNVHPQECVIDMKSGKVYTDKAILDAVDRGERKLDALQAKISLEIDSRITPYGTEDEYQDIRKNMQEAILSAQEEIMTEINALLASATPINQGSESGHEMGDE